MHTTFQIGKVVVPALFGIMFILSYFLADKSWFFEYLAYFPRKREGALKIGGLVFGCGFCVVAIINYLLLP